MANYDYGFLDQADEDQVHKSRLLSIEDRAFKRITKRLLAPDCLISSPPTSLPTPPPDSTTDEDNAAAEAAGREKQAEERRRWREEMLLDFAAFESSIARIQLLRTSNERERERYAAEKVKILDTAQAIKESTAALRVQLEEARKLLAVRKTYDELAEKITSNRMLRPREDQHAQLEKLNAEIAELEQESRDYARTWAERREQFGRIVEEGRQMLRLIRDEKEEAERKEGMEGGDDAYEPDDIITREDRSHAGTPRPDHGGATPMRASQEGDNVAPARLQVNNDRLAPPSPLTGGSSRDHSPHRRDASRHVEGDVDEMDTREASVAPADAQEDADSDIEEGEEAESPQGDKMDVT